MKLNSIKDADAFKAAIDACSGEVYLKSVYGDVYNLKSDLSRYLAIADLLHDKSGDLELFARLPEDQLTLMKFLDTLNEE